MKITFVAAMSENGVIGNDGALPWHLPNDFKHFKRLTVGKNILMGRKTFTSIGRALPNRQNYVLTRNRTFHAEDVTVFHSKHDVLNAGFSELIVIGGAELYQMFLHECTHVFLTLVHATIPGDTYFPSLDGFIETHRETFAADQQHAYSYSFIEYEKPTS